jgi:hypothetical protein
MIFTYFELYLRIIPIVGIITIINIIQDDQSIHVRVAVGMINWVSRFVDNHHHHQSSSSSSSSSSSYSLFVCIFKIFATPKSNANIEWNNNNIIIIVFWYQISEISRAEESTLGIYSMRWGSREKAAIWMFRSSRRNNIVKVILLYYVTLLIISSLGTSKIIFDIIS